jgi:hypothetical protein
MDQKKHLCICGSEYMHASSLSKHRKVCRDVIIAEYKKTEENKVIVAAPVTAYHKKLIIDYLNEECNDTVNCLQWVEDIGDYFKLADYENLIENGIMSWKENVVRYIEELPRSKLPLRISNRQLGARFKLFYKESGKWIELQGNKATDFFFQKIIRRMGRRMGNNIKNKSEWKEANPYWETNYELEKRYMTIGATFGEHFEDKIVPEFAEKILDYFTTSKKSDDDDYI